MKPQQPSLADQLNECLTVTRFTDTIWDVVFSSIIPQAQENVLALLTQNQGSRASDQLHKVEFGQNTHELVERLMSDAIRRDGALRVLCSDTEFYSFNRQVVPWRLCLTCICQLCTATRLLHLVI